MIHSPNLETPKRELLVFYYKYRRRLVLSFMLPFLAFVFISFVPTPRYEAGSTLVVRMGAEYVYQPEVGATANGQPSPIPFDNAQIAKAEVAILGSTDLHEEVIQSVGLDRMYPMKKKDAHSPVSSFCTAIVAKLDQWFPDDADDSLSGRAASALRISLQDYGTNAVLSPEDQNHKRLERAAESFNKNLKISLEKESAVIDLSFQHADRAVAIEALDTLLKFYMDKRKQLYMETRSTQAKQQAELTHHRVVAIEGQIESFKHENKIYSLTDQRTQLLQQREEVRKQMASVSNVALEDKLDNITAQLDALDAQERQYNSLQQDLQVANNEYTIYAHELDEAQSYDNIEHARAGSVRVIQPPSAPPEPKRLQWLIILAGFMLSLVSTALVAAYTEFARSGFLTPERLQRSVGLPILCALPLRKE